MMLTRYTVLVDLRVNDEEDSSEESEGGDA